MQSTWAASVSRPVRRSCWGRVRGEGAAIFATRKHTHGHLGPFRALFTLPLSLLIKHAIPPHKGLSLRATCCFLSWFTFPGIKRSERFNLCAFLFYIIFIIFLSKSLNMSLIWRDVRVFIPGLFFLISRKIGLNFHAHLFYHFLLRCLLLSPSDTDLKARENIFLHSWTLPVAPMAKQQL